MTENRIGSERVRLRLSQEELGEKMGVTNKTISAWEQDVSRCSSKVIVELSKIFGCTTDYLTGQSRRHFDDVSA